MKREGQKSIREPGMGSLVTVLLLRYHDQGDTYECKYLTGDLSAVSEMRSVIIVGSMAAGMMLEK